MKSKLSESATPVGTHPSLATTEPFSTTEFSQRLQSLRKNIMTILNEESAHSEKKEKVVPEWKKSEVRNEPLFTPIHEAYQKKLKEAQKEEETLQQIITDLTSEKKEVESEVEALKKQLSDTESENEELAMTMGEKENELEELKKKVSETEAALKKKERRFPNTFGSCPALIAASM